MKSTCGLVAFMWLILPFLETGETGKRVTHPVESRCVRETHTEAFVRCKSRHGRLIKVLVRGVAELVQLPLSVVHLRPKKSLIATFVLSLTFQYIIQRGLCGEFPCN